MTYDDFTWEMQERILSAQKIAKELNHKYVTLAHLVLACMRDEDSRKVIQSTLDDEGAFVQMQEDVFAYLPSRKSKEAEKQYLTEDANRALSRALQLSKDLKLKEVSPEVFLAAVSALDENRIAEIFDEVDSEPVEYIKSIELTK